MRLGLWWLAAFSCLVLMGCEPSGPTHTGAGVYVIREKDTDEVRARMLESVNFLRQSAGIAPVTINPLLTEAALRHSEDMSRQQRAWAFGSDGSNPYTRVLRAGYQGDFVSEMYSETFESEQETVAAWLEDRAWGPELLNAEASEIGIAWHQDESGRLWWTVTFGKAASPIPSL